MELPWTSTYALPTSEYFCSIAEFEASFHRNVCLSEVSRNHAPHLHEEIARMLTPRDWSAMRQRALAWALYKHDTATVLLKSTKSKGEDIIPDIVNNTTLHALLQLLHPTLVTTDAARRARAIAAVTAVFQKEFGNVPVRVTADGTCFCIEVLRKIGSADLE